MHRVSSKMLIISLSAGKWRHTFTLSYMQIEELIWGNCYWLHPLIYWLILNPFLSGLCKSRALMCIGSDWISDIHSGLCDSLLKWGQSGLYWKENLMKTCDWMEMVLNWFCFKTQTLYWASSGDSKHRKSLSNSKIKPMFCLQCVKKNNVEYYVL